MRVVLAGGGSAGHIEPAVALADALREADASIGVTCLGTERGLETRLVPLRGYELELIPAVPLPRSVTPQLLSVPGRLAGAVHAVGAILDRVGADVLVGFGGYVATPAYLAARRHKVPIVVHEANLFPGIANRLGAHLTTHVFTAHPDTKLRNGTYLGLPIRREIAELDRFARGDRAREYFGLRRDLPVLLVFGGSQGARSLNRAIAGALDAIRNVGVQVLHVTGPKNSDDAPPTGGFAASSAVPYVAVPYVDEMALAYAAADFALCRAGANTCAELTAVGLPAAYVPLPFGNGEQRLNAQPIIARGGGLLVDDAELTPEWIKASLLPVLTDIDQVAAMSEAAASMGRKDADRWLAQAVLDIVAAETVSRSAEPGEHPDSPLIPPTPGRHRQARLTIIRAHEFREGSAMALVTPTEPVPLGELGRVHFAGIGGAGMSGIARIMLARGISVSGSDTGSSAVLAELAALGAVVHAGQAAGQLGDADTLVISSAIRADNPELVEAGARGLRVLHRAAALASLMAGRRGIAVTGTHGKTTTTSMITTVLLETGADPAYAIGGVLAATGTGAADGDGAYFVAEADESDGSFLMYSPEAAVVTNVEADHLDNYGTTRAYRASFDAFLRRISPGGLLVTCADDPGTRDLAARGAGLGLRVVSYGVSADADYRLTRVTARGMQTNFSIGAGERRPGPFGRIDCDLALRVPGQHNALNAAAAFAVTVELGIEPARAAAALASYRGAARRLEPKGEAGGVRVLDSYAHHPTELAADLRAARDIAGGGGRVIAVFQPHLYSRTRVFAAEFGAALGLADEAVVLDVYAAREDPEPGVTGRLVADAVPGGAARYVPEFGDVPAVVAALAAPGDLVLTMGAGDITRMGPLVLDAITAPVAIAGIRSGSGAPAP